MQSTKESASAAADRAHAAANTIGQTAEQNKEEAADFLHQLKWKGKLVVYLRDGKKGRSTLHLLLNMPSTQILTMLKV